VSDGDGDLGVLDGVALSVAVGVGVSVTVGVGEPQPSQKSRLSPPHPASAVIATTAIATDHIRARMAAGYRAACRESR
jgi:hypothetical protein